MSIRIGLGCVLAIGLSGPAALANGLSHVVAVKAVTATSTLAGKDDRYAPVRALDWRSDTAWCEGAPDEGVGQSWTVTFATPTVVDEVELQPGMRKSDKLFNANNRPSRLEVKADDGKSVSVTWKKQERPMVKLSGTPITRLTIIFAEVEKAAMNDTCLSDIRLRRGGETLTPVTGTTAAALTSFPTAVRELSRALKVCDAKALAAKVRFPISTILHRAGDTPSLKARYRDAAALVAACKREQAPGGEAADEIVQKQDVGGLLTRRLRVDELVVDPFMGWDIGQPWSLSWAADRGWQLTAVGP